MARTKVFDAPFSGINLERLTDILGVAKTNVLGEWYADPRGAGSFYDMSGNARHLTASSAVTLGRSTIVGHDGNLLNAFEYSGSNYHSLAYDPNCFDGDFSLTMMAKTPRSHPGATLVLFSHSAGIGTDGFYLRYYTNGYIDAFVSDSGLSPTYKQASSNTSYSDGLYHIIHVVRNSSMLVVYVDGVPGTPMECSGYGDDASRTLYMACMSAANFYTQPISYCRLQNSALTYTQITREVAAFQGILCTRGGTQKYVVPTFIRSTTSQSSKRAASTQFHTVPINWPVKSTDGAVLIEGAVTPLGTYTSDFGTGWTKTRASIASTSVVLPDGSTSTTATLHEGVAGDGDATHVCYHSLSCTSGSSYCYSEYFKYNPAAGTPREWVALRVEDGTEAKRVSFNIRYRYVGTTYGNLTGGSGIEPLENGWVRCWVWATAGVTQAGIAATNVALADNDIDFVGADQDSVFMCWPQIETGAFPTQYQPNPTTGATRSSDFMVVCPFNITKQLGIAGQIPRLLFNGTESLNAATVTPTTGAYSFTKNGRPQNITSEAEGDGWRFNGSTDYLTYAHNTDFNPAGDFTVVVALTPFSVTGSAVVFGKYGAIGNYGYYIYQTTTGIVFARSVDGTNWLSPTVATCLEIGKPVLITASFSTTDGMKLWVDAFTVGTNATTTATYQTTGSSCIGASTSGGGPFNHRLHYLAYYDGYAAVAADHSTNYARWKVDGILPLSMSASTPRTKLGVEMAAKGQFKSVSDMNGSKRLFTIGGNTGVSGNLKNVVTLFAYSATGVNWSEVVTDTSTVERYISTAARTNHDSWTSHKMNTDCSDLSASTYSVDGTLQSTKISMSGTASFDFKDSLIRIGQAYSAAVTCNSYVKEFKLYVE